MEEKQETVADIVAEMRDRKDMLRNAISSAPLCYPVDDMQAKVEILDEFIDRIEAEHKREVGNGAKMREALKQILALAKAKGLFEIQSLAETALAALAESPRNCDVGTVEGQTRRLRAHCAKSTCEECKASIDIVQGLCWLKWAQMPYEEGGEK